MAFTSIDPATGEAQACVEAWDEARLEAALERAEAAFRAWSGAPLAERCRLLEALAAELRRRREELARLMSREMGKLLGEALAEVDKCAWVCEHYAAHAPAFLAPEPAACDAPRRCWVGYEPLGPWLAVMPWNFPFWQVLRCAAPALAAGNVVLLKHASNVPRCALALEGLFQGAGFPEGVFQSLMIPASLVGRVVDDARVRGVSLTGSEAAGREVAARAGAALKRTVLELGGSDPFLVLEDADLEEAARTAVAARFLNAGQSCIAAKRLIVVEAVAGPFLEALTAGIRALRPGDPLDPATTLAPLAREDLRRQLHHQVEASVARGAVPLLGCEPLPGRGWFYAPSLLDRVRPGMPAFDEELFGPVAAVVRAADEDEAVALANRSRYGLGASVWTRDRERGERVGRRLASGMVFVNGMVKSDPRLPFGGVKDSGYGRELGHHGLREFVNVRTWWVG